MQFIYLIAWKSNFDLLSGKLKVRCVTLLIKITKFLPALQNTYYIQITRLSKKPFSLARFSIFFIKKIQK